jgi:hypothetical protein
MKYIKLYEIYKNKSEYHNHHNDNDNEYFFIRVTKDPQGDLERGFSCQAGCWTDNLEDALEWQEREGALVKPQQDPKTKGWCYDPELGISSFGFNIKKE